MMRCYLVLLWVLVPVWTFAQDIIQLKDKSVISARVVSEDKESVTYLVQEDGEHVLRTIPSGEVKKVKYEKVPKNVNMILIEHDSLTNEYLLNDIINHIIVSGYAIDEFNNKYYSVSTAYVGNDRITVEIAENNAYFRCFQLGYEEKVLPHGAATLAWGKKPKPGEKIEYPGSTAFKKLDDLCRSYLKDGHSQMSYRAE